MGAVASGPSQLHSGRQEARVASDEHRRDEIRGTLTRKVRRMGLREYGRERQEESAAFRGRKDAAPQSQSQHVGPATRRRSLRPAPHSRGAGRADRRRCRPRGKPRSIGVEKRALRAKPHGAIRLQKRSRKLRYEHFSRGQRRPRRRMITCAEPAGTSIRG